MKISSDQSDVMHSHPTLNTLSVSLCKSTRSILPFVPKIERHKPNEFNEKKLH